MSFKAHVLQGVPYEDVKVVKESEKVWESLFVRLRSYRITRGCLSGNGCRWRSGTYQVM